MCVCVYVCTRACVHECLRVHARVCMLVFLRASGYVYKCVMRMLLSLCVYCVIERKRKEDAWKDVLGSKDEILI